MLLPIPRRQRVSSIDESVKLEPVENTRNTHHEECKGTAVGDDGSNNRRCLEYTAEEDAPGESCSPSDDFSGHKHVASNSGIKRPSTLNLERAINSRKFRRKGEDRSRQASLEPASFVTPPKTFPNMFLNLNGEYGAPFDQIVVGIVQRLVAVARSNRDTLATGAASLEVEGRLGVICDGRRLHLPFDREALLEPPSPEFPYKFESGVGVNQFERLTTGIQHVLDLAGPTTAEPFVVPHPAARVGYAESSISASLLETRDQIFAVPEVILGEAIAPKSQIDRDSNASRRIRVSTVQFPPVSSSRPNVIWKDNQFSLNVYTGRDRHQQLVDIARDRQDDDSNQQPLDFRISVNLEHKLNYTPTSESSKLVLTRHRSRTSYRILGRYRVDSTRVVSEDLEHQQQHSSRFGSRGGAPPERGIPAPTVSYEWEVELNPRLVIKEVQKMQQGKRNRLMELVRDFTNILRGAAKWLNSDSISDPSASGLSSSMTAPGEAPLLLGSGTSTSLLTRNSQAWRRYANLKDCGPREERLRNYLEFVSPVIPLIGDYLFRAVAQQRKETGCKTLSRKDIEESEKRALTPEELAELRERLSEQ